MSSSATVMGVPLPLRRSITPPVLVIAIAAVVQFTPAASSSAMVWAAESATRLMIFRPVDDSGDATLQLFGCQAYLHGQFRGSVSRVS